MPRHSPAGCYSAAPYMVMDDAAKALDSYQQVFRVKDVVRPRAGPGHALPDARVARRIPPRERHSVRVAQVYQASPTAVFDAWITPSIVRQWLFISPISKNIKTRLDVRVGGEFSIIERGAAGEIEYFGSYVEIDRPRRLAFTLQVPRHFPGITYVMARFEDIPGGTELTLTQDSVPPEVTAPSWQAILFQLAEILNGPVSA